MENEQKNAIISAVLNAIIKVLFQIAQTKDIAATVQKPLEKAMELVGLLSKPKIDDDEVIAALDEATAALAVLEAESAA